MSTRTNFPFQAAGRRAKLAAGAALICMAFSAAEAIAEESISFPARAADLPSGSYWAVTEFSEGCCTLDLNVLRWNGSKWKGDSGDAQNQAYDWNLPLYAPASGVIASCWRNFPDDPASGAALENEDKIFTGGNHVAIVTDAGNVDLAQSLEAGHHSQASFARRTRATSNIRMR